MGRLADNIRMDPDGYYTTGFAQGQKYFSLETKWVNEECGKHNDGRLVKLDPLFIYCPVDSPNNNTELDKKCIEQAENYIRGIIRDHYEYKYSSQAPSFTLHLAVYSFTSTEYIENRFVTASPQKLSTEINDTAIDLRIEYEQVFSTYKPSNPTDQRIVYLLNELSQEDVETTNDLKDSYITTYCVWSDGVHYFYEKSEEFCQNVGACAIWGAVIIGSCVAIVDPAILPIAIPVLRDIASKTASGASHVGAVLSFADANLYKQDGLLLDDNEKYMQGIDMQNRLIFKTFTSYGFKYFIVLPIKTALDNEAMGKLADDLGDLILASADDEESSFSSTNNSEAIAVNQTTHKQLNIPVHSERRTNELK